MTAKTCGVSCRDPNGIEHSVEVMARTLYEAVGRGLQIFRANEWIDGLGRNSALSVFVKSPEITHNVRIIDFENWLEGSGKSPAGQALKGELRALLTKGSHQTPCQNDAGPWHGEGEDLMSNTQVPDARSSPPRMTT